MTGTNLYVNNCKQSRSYLNHPVYDYTDFITGKAVCFVACYFEIFNSLKYGCTNVIVLFHPMLRRLVSDRELLCLKVPRLCPLGRDNIQMKMKH